MPSRARTAAKVAVLWLYERRILNRHVALWLFRVLKLELA